MLYSTTAGRHSPHHRPPVWILLNELTFTCQLTSAPHEMWNDEDNNPYAFERRESDFASPASPDSRALPPAKYSLTWWRLELICTQTLADLRPHLQPHLLRPTRPFPLLRKVQEAPLTTKKTMKARHRRSSREREEATTAASSRSYTSILIYTSQSHTPARISRAEVAISLTRLGQA